MRVFLMVVGWIVLVLSVAMFASATDKPMTLEIVPALGILIGVVMISSASIIGAIEGLRQPQQPRPQPPQVPPSS